LYSVHPRPTGIDATEPSVERERAITLN
jgi:hypothetical protein